MAEQSAERFNSSGGNLLIFVRLHAGDADRADAGAVDDDGHAALHGRHFGHATELDALRHPLLPVRGRAARLGGGASLLERDARVGGRRAVHAREVQEMPAIVEDGNAHVPVVPSCFGFGGARHLLAVVERQHGTLFHERRASLICVSAAGSSMVVRSPGSRPSANAWMARRRVLPERVFGSSVTKCTAFGRAIAPSCRSTICITSSAEVRFAASLSTANARGICPFRSSATPTTAHSATFGCMLTASSISRVPRRWPATLMTSSVRPRM